MTVKDKSQNRNSPLSTSDALDASIAALSQLNQTLESPDISFKSSIFDSNVTKGSITVPVAAPAQDNHQTWSLEELVENAMLPGYYILSTFQPTHRKQMMMENRTRFRVDPLINSLNAYISNLSKKIYIEDSPEFGKTVASRNASFRFQSLWDKFTRKYGIVPPEPSDGYPTSSSDEESASAHEDLPPLYESSDEESEPQEAVETKSWWQRLKTVSVDIPEKDRTLIKTFTKTVKDFPAHVAQASERVLAPIVNALPDKERVGELLEAASDKLKSFTDFTGIPTSIKKFIMMILDVVTLALSTDNTIWYLQQFRLVMDYGFLGTVLIDGIAAFAQQLIKRSQRPVTQGKDDNKIDPTWYDHMTAFFSAIHHYTIGQLPTSVPANLIKDLVLINAAFQLGKNLEHFGPLLLKLIRTCIDGIWRLFTKKPFFSQEQTLVLEKIKKQCLELSTIVKIEAPAPHDIRSANNLVNELRTSYAAALGLGVAESDVKALPKFISAFEEWIGIHAGPAEYNDPRTPAITTLFIGEAGAGKNLMLEFMNKSLATILEFDGDFSQMVCEYQIGVNFQPPPTWNPKFLTISDGLLIKDDATRNEIISFLNRQGTSAPALHEAAGVNEKKRGYDRYAFIDLTENVIPDLQVTTPEAVARRINGGIHNFTVRKEYQDSAGKIDITKIHRNMTQDEIDNVFVYVDHVGVTRNMSQMVAMRAALYRAYNRRGKIISAASSNVASNFKLVDAVISPAPRTLTVDFAKFNRPSKDPKYAGTIYVPVKDIVSPPDKAKSQALVNLETSDKLEKYLRDKSADDAANKEYLATVINWMKNSAADFRFQDGVLTKNGARVDPLDLARRFIPQNKAATVNIKVYPQKWTADVLEAMKDKTFYVHKTCCRYEDFCYVHADDPCQAHHPDAKRVSIGGLAEWALSTQNFKGTTGSYFVLTSLLTPADPMDSPVMSAFKTLAIAVSGFAVGAMIVAFVNWAMKSYSTRRKVTSQSSDEPVIDVADSQGAYENKGAMFARHPENKYPQLPLPGVFRPKVQSDTKATPYGWLLKKLKPNIVPIRVYSKDFNSTLRMLRVVGNLAVSNRHPFLEDSTTICMGGLINLSLPIRYIEKVSDLKENVVHVQVLRDDRLDLAFLVLPKSILACKDIRKYLVDAAEPVSAMTGIFMAKPLIPEGENILTVESDGKVKVDPLREVSAFPLGDANAIFAFEASDSMDYLGLYVKSAVETSDGDCSCPYITTNHYVGRNHGVILGLHAAWSDAHAQAIMTPLPRQAVEMFISACPAGVLSLVRMQSLPEYTPTEERIKDDLPTFGLAPVPQFQNKHNTIRPVHHDVAYATVGMEFIHPATGEACTVQPPNVGPAPIWDIKPAFAKLKTHAFVPTPENFEQFKAAGKQVEAAIRKFANQKLLQPRTEIHSIKEALNGIPELGIPALDPTKSPGYQPGFTTKNGRWDYLEGEAPNLDLKLEYKIIVDNICHDIIHKKMKWVHVVANLKEELRKIGKAARMTSAYWFLHLIVIRRFTLLLPSILMSGRGFNGTTFGSDPSAEDGRKATAARHFYDHSINVDAVNYDASKSPFYSSVSEEISINLLLPIFPFLDWDQLSIPIRWSRICLLIIGRLVLLRYFGMMSGHPITTPLNCEDSLTNAVHAWLRCDPKDPEGNSIADEFFLHNFARAYGDDFSGMTNVDQFDNYEIVAAGAANGIEYTDAFDKTREVQKYTPYAEDYHLKRLEYQDFNGYTHSVLEASVLTRIHSFIRGKDKDVREATTQNAESELYEWAQVSRAAFTEAKFRLDNALMKNGFRPTKVQYQDAYCTWFNNNGGARLVRNTGLPFAPAAVADVPHMGKARSQASKESMVTHTFDPMQDTFTSVDVNPSAITKVNPTSGVATTQKLTTTQTEASVSISRLTLMGNSVPRGLAPFEPSGVDENMTREYILDVFTWNTDGTGNAANFTFPEDLFSIPNIVSKLSRLKYGEWVIGINASITGSRYARGALNFAWIPNTFESAPSDWRQQQDLCYNSKSWILSAKANSSIKFQLPQATPFACYDIPNLEPVGSSGMLYVDPLAPLKFGSTSSPSSLPVTLRASFVKSHTTGFSTNDGPTMLEALHEIVRKKRNPQKPNGPSFSSELARFGHHHMGRGHSQSADEAGQKSSTGILDGVKSATSTVSGIIDAVGSLEPLLALLDKPVENATVIPMRYEAFSDSISSKGVAQAPFLAAVPSAYVTLKNGLMSEMSPQPTWDKILQIPGCVFQDDLNANMTAGTILYATNVWPLLSKELMPGESYLPAPIGFYGIQHKYWHGDLKFLICLFSPENQSWSGRVSYYPNKDVNTALAGVDSGDVITLEFDVAGDQFVPFKCEWQSTSLQLPTGRPESAVDENGVYCGIGSIVVECTKPILTQSTAVACSPGIAVFFAAEKGMTLEQPRTCPGPYLLSTAPSLGAHAKHSYLKRAAVKDGHIGMNFAKMFSTTQDHKGKGKSQACIRDMFGEPFPSLAAVSHSRTTRNIVDPDRVSGPIEMMRRPHTRAIAAPCPANLVAGPLSASSMYDIMCPFAFWSGGWAFHIMVSPAKMDVPGYLKVGIDHNVVSTNLEENDWGDGVRIVDTRNQPVCSFTVPHSHMNPAFELDGDHDHLLEYNQYSVQWQGDPPGEGGEPPLNIFESVADDFSLYHFVASGFIHKPAVLAKKHQARLQQRFLAKCERMRTLAEMGTSSSATTPKSDT